jgi:indolepyruvate ferredoxin oxidoreductase
MVLLMDEKQVGQVIGTTQMGGEGTQWIGMAPFVENPHLIQNLGDGTFHHSGSLAIRASIAAKTNITYRLLYNSTVAMTGGQDAVGQMRVAEIARVLLAEGVAKVIVTSDDPRSIRRQRLPEGVEVWPRERLDEAQIALAQVTGTTVLIHEQECATELRRKRKRGLAPKPQEFVMINERICEGCGDCGEKSNCLSVQPVDTEFGRKTRIHQSSCNVDKSCLSGDCPAFITVRPGEAGSDTAHPATIEASDLPLPPASAQRSHRIRIMGIGGTGVVTTSQLLATAAVLAGRYARTLERTGLAQKGGAVVSDVAIEAGPFTEGNTLGEASCDLYLGYDLLVAADPGNLRGLAVGATALISTSIVPTGKMVTDTAVQFPQVRALLARITEHASQTQVLDLDLRRYAETLFGSEQLANTFLLGVAVQRGALSLPPESIEEAINLNGVAVNANVQAFRRGRQFVADRAALDAEVSRLEPARDDEQPAPSRIVRAAPGSELERLVALRRHELRAYQNEAYAQRYEHFIEQVRAAEMAQCPLAGDSDGTHAPGTLSLPFSEAVARNLYKLMAYKDEYEVARLALDPTMRAEVEQQFGRAARVSWRLHPPTLKALGLKQKIALGSWFAPAFAGLKFARALRGTPFDVFGYDKMRKLERQLIREYEDEVRDLLTQLRPDTLQRAVQIAELPDMIRGYEDVKLRNVKRYREQLAEIKARL